MAFSTEQVLDMLDTSGVSDIEEDPTFLLPHDSESEEDEPQPQITTPAIQDTDTATSDSSDEENVTPGKIHIISNNTLVFHTKNQ